MKKERRKITASFKAKVALEAIKEVITIEEIASKYQIHLTQIASWKREFLEKPSWYSARICQPLKRKRTQKRRNCILKSGNFKFRWTL